MLNYFCWIVPVLVLFVVAWVRFNDPPTNRSGTTYFLFYLGIAFYAALLVGIWFFVIVSLKAGGLGLGALGQSFGSAVLQAGSQGTDFIPFFGVLIIVVASQFPRVKRIDAAARRFCIELAAIPREAEQLAAEIAQRSALNLTNPQLRSRVSQEVVESVGQQGLNFDNDGTLSSAFTRAVSLYWLFLVPYTDTTPLPFPSSSDGRSTYVTTMRLYEKVIGQAAAAYRKMMINGLAYFAATGSKDAENALRQSVREVSNLVSALIARYVLLLDKSASHRRKRLSSMGFDTEDCLPPLGRDQWIAVTLVIAVLLMLMSTLLPGRDHEIGEKLSLSVRIALQLGMAVIGGTSVARRFIQRNDGTSARFPPLVELVVAGLVVVGLCIGLRIAWPLLADFLASGTVSLSKALASFAERWAWIFMPLVCTVSIGLLCSYLGSLAWSRLRASAVGAAGNGVAFAATGFFISQLIGSGAPVGSESGATTGKLIVVSAAGTTGALLGGMVLAFFHHSFRWSNARMGDQAAASPVNGDHGASASIGAPIQVAAPPPVAPSTTVASMNLGGYARVSVAEVEGRYVCFRPVFGNASIINAYLITIGWDQAHVCLTFEEQERYDKLYTHKGQVYVPGDKPFMSLVTVDKGAVRLLMVTRPDGDGLARGLVVTLSNPESLHFVPAVAPIVLRRATDPLPQLGFVHPGSPDYGLYFSQLSGVMPDFGRFTNVYAGKGKPKRLTVVGATS
jgi:hypothetical protein